MNSAPTLLLGVILFGVVIPCGVIILLQDLRDTAREDRAIREARRAKAEAEDARQRGPGPRGYR